MPAFTHSALDVQHLMDLMGVVSGIVDRSERTEIVVRISIVGIADPRIAAIDIEAGVGALEEDLFAVVLVDKVDVILRIEDTFPIVQIVINPPTVPGFHEYGFGIQACRRSSTLEIIHSVTNVYRGNLCVLEIVGVLPTIIIRSRPAGEIIPVVVGGLFTNMESPDGFLELRVRIHIVKQIHIVGSEHMGIVGRHIGLVRIAAVVIGVIAKRIVLGTRHIRFIVSHSAEMHLQPMSVEGLQGSPHHILRRPFIRIISLDNIKAVFRHHIQRTRIHLVLPNHNGGSDIRHPSVGRIQERASKHANLELILFYRLLGLKSNRGDGQRPNQNQKSSCFLHNCLFLVNTMEHPFFDKKRTSLI